MVTSTLADLLRLDGRIAVVTGGAQGIGAAIVTRLAEAGATVVSADSAERDQTSTNEVHRVHVDLLEPGAIETLAANTESQFGTIGIWINNAGIYPSANVIEMSDEEWDLVIDLNLRATFRGSRTAAKVMRDGKAGGVIVNIASNAAFASGPNSAHYVASKHGVAGLTKALAVDLAQYGIRVVGIAPGVTRTEGIEVASQALRAAGWGDLNDYAERTVPLGRMAIPDEIARMVVVMASDLAAYVSGTTVVIDGGQVSSFT